MPHCEPGTLPNFQSHAEALRVVVEGQRLTYGHLVDPTFATETAQIDPLPHQRLAVYHHLQQQCAAQALATAHTQEPGSAGTGRPGGALD